MKKLMIAAAIVCAAVAAQATSCSWKIQGTQIGGDFEEGEGTFATGWLVYLVGTDGGLSKQSLVGSIQSAHQEGISALSTYMDTIKSDSAVGGNQGYIDRSIDIGEATEYSAFLVIFNAEKLKDSDYFFVSDEAYTSTTTKLSTFMDWDGDKWVNALDYDQRTSGPESNWNMYVATPEPTSAMLMLLGVAGLALRRKQK